jgi:thioredoxin reductase
LFTFGFDHRGSSSAGILAVGFAGNPMHANILVDDVRKFTNKITIYTNGNDQLAQGIRKAASYNDTLYDDRKIKSFIRQEKSVVIEFEDGEKTEEDFIVHQPATRVNPLFVKQLGLELNERGDIITKMPFYQTSAQGVFAAGDCASPFKIISNAVLMGANAGAGIARELPTRVTGNVIDRLA